MFAYTLILPFFMLREDVCGGFFYNYFGSAGHLSHVALDRHIQPCCMCTQGYNACSFCSLAAPAIEFFTSLDTPALRMFELHGQVLPDGGVVFT